MNFVAQHAPRLVWWSLIVLATVMLVMTVGDLRNGIQHFWGNPRFPVWRTQGFQPNAIPLVPSLVATTLRLVTGVILGVTGGILIGLFAHLDKKQTRRYLLLLLLLAPVSPIIWSRALTGRFGFGNTVCIVVITITSSIIVAIATILSLKKYPQEFAAISRCHQVPWFRELTWIKLPYLFPQIEMFVRLCLLLGWGTIFYAESSGGVTNGFGRLFMEIYMTNSMSAVYLVAVVLILVALLLDFIVARLCRAIGGTPST